MELVHEFDYYGTLKPPVVFGSRMFLETRGREPATSGSSVHCR